jgi:predicted transcriptional regulator
MNEKLPAELRQAIQRNPHLRLEDEQTHVVYVVVDEETHQRAMRALQEQEDLAAIQRGLDDRAHGREQPLEEVDAEIREEFGFPPPGK